MKSNFTFFVGILTFAFVIGLMTGASNSPVAGGVITSIFGIVLAMLGLLTNKEAEFKIKLNLIGCGFILLSIGLILGIYAGIKYRTEDPIASTDKKFIWEGYKEPKTTYEAIDWIITNDLLISRGFSRQQVQSIYLIRLKEISEADSARQNSTAPWMIENGYSKENPFFKMIVGGYQNNLLQRSIANDPNAGKNKTEVSF